MNKQLSKIKLKNIRALIFDMDGVITNTMPDHFRAWKEILADEGIDVSHLDVYLREGQKGIQSVTEIFQKYKKPCDDKILEQILAKKESLFEKIVKTRFIPGSRRFISSMRRVFNLALVTGTSRHEMKKILPKKLIEAFSVIVTGDDVRNGKPDPEPFLKALSQLNVSPREAVVIENAPFGIRSAKAAGLRCLALETSLPKQYLKSADHVFSSFRHLQTATAFEPATRGNDACFISGRAS